MKKIGFVGAADKTDVILSIAKVLTMAEKKVLVIDTTLMQKCKYIVPVINPTKSYITTYDNFDVAVGFEDLVKLKQYQGLDEDEQMDYDYCIIDIDSYDAFANFQMQSAEKNYYVTTYEMYSLKKGIEIISQLRIPIRFTKIFFSQYMTGEEEEYFDYLALGSKAMWDDEKVYFSLNEHDYAAIVENQRISKIKLSNLTEDYKKNIKFLINNIDPNIDDRYIKNIIKEI